MSLIESIKSFNYSYEELWYYYLEKIKEFDDVNRLDELIEVMANSKKVCHQFHLPLQSGSDRLLKLMNRHYTKTANVNAKELRQNQTDTESIEKQLRNRMFFNETFNTGIFSEFDFFDKTRDIIITSLTPFKIKNNEEKKNKIDLLTLTNNEINNNLILDICINNTLNN